MDLRTFAREATMPQCCLYKPGDERNTTATVDGIEIASWPLSPDTVAALTTKYAGRVPADDVILYDFHDTTDCVNDSCLLGQLGIARECDDYNLKFELELAHFAIDLTGDASMLTPTTEQPPSTFATVVYFFPSTCVGGAVTISHGHRTTTYEALDGRFLTFYNTCDVVVAPITSGHRSFAVHHAAYDLCEYDSDDSFGPKARFTAPPLPSIQELQVAARRYKPKRKNGVLIGLDTRSLTPTFGSLTGRDKAVVEHLLVADVFDIAFARGGICKDENKDSWSLPETCYPLCKTPTCVQIACRETPAYCIAKDADEYDGCFLLVWPKARRLRILGYDRTIALLRANVDGDVTEHLGYASLQGLFEAAFRFFYPHSWIEYGGDPEQDTYAMASVLYDHGDVGLIEAFLDVHDCWTDDETMVDWLLAVLRRFGAPRIEARLQTANISISFVARLVHLATSGDTLAHSIARDRVPLWWPRMLHLTKNRGFFTDVLGHLLDLETFMLAHPKEMSVLLGRHLPNVLVRQIAAFVFEPPASLLDYMRGNTHATSCLPVVLRSRRASLDSARLTSYIALATEFFCSPAARPHHQKCQMYDLLRLAMLTAGTPAFATVDAEVRMCYRDDVWFQTKCAQFVKETTSTMEALVLEEYMRMVDDDSEDEMSS